MKKTTPKRCERDNISTIIRLLELNENERTKKKPPRKEFMCVSYLKYFEQIKSVMSTYEKKKI